MGPEWTRQVDSKEGSKEGSGSCRRDKAPPRPMGGASDVTREQEKKRKSRRCSKILKVNWGLYRKSLS